LQALVQSKFADLNNKLAVTVKTPRLLGLVEDVKNLRAELGGKCVSALTDVSQLRESLDIKIEQLSSKLDAEICGLQDSLEEVAEMAGNVSVDIPDFSTSNSFTELVSRVESVERYGQSTIALMGDGAELAVGESNINVAPQVIHRNLQDYFEARIADITRKLEETEHLGSLSDSTKLAKSEVIYKNLQEHFDARLAAITR